MNTWIVLLRGINVGGKNIVPMKDLRTLLERLGFEDVQTYIQSGNCVLRSAHTDAHHVSSEVSDGIFETFGFRPGVMTLSKAALIEALQTNPFSSEGEADPKSVHFTFFDETPTAPDLDSLQSLRTPTERFELTEAAFYLFAPDGIGRSKLAAQVERRLGVTVTGRNQRTMLKLADLAG